MLSVIRDVIDPEQLLEPQNRELVLKDADAQVTLKHTAKEALFAVSLNFKGIDNPGQALYPLLRHRKSCDFIVFSERKTGTVEVLLVELKQGATGEAMEQLNNSIPLVEQILRSAALHGSLQPFELKLGAIVFNGTVSAKQSPKSQAVPDPKYPYLPRLTLGLRGWPISNLLDLFPRVRKPSAYWTI